MIHHDSRDYNVAASAAARNMRDKMEALIAKGVNQATTVIGDVTNRVINDRIIRTNTMRIRTPDSKGEKWGIIAGDVESPVHHHAFTQILSNAEMPRKYADDLMAQANGSDWGNQLVAYNLNEIFRHRNLQRNLIREADGQVKGFLSDKFKRIDSRQLLDAFATMAKEVNLVPIEGYAQETRVKVRTILPYIFEPIDNEVMTVGLEWGNSDFGHGGHYIKLLVNRLVCTNYATMEEVLRQVHLGKRLNDDITYSEETYRADTKANVLALRDVVRNVIGPEKVNALMSHIKACADQTVGKDILAVLKKHKELGKEDVERIVAAYESPDVVNLPPGENLWRLSNAVSWVAQSKDMGEDKKLELQEVAGKLIPHKPTAAVAV